MARLIRMLLVCGAAAGLGCGPREECPNGEATNVSIKDSSGNSSTVSHRTCASAAQDGVGVIEIKVSLNVGTLKELQIDGNHLDTLGSDAICSKGVSVTLWDDTTNYLDYISNNWTSDWRTTPPSSCTVVATRNGDRVEGSFTGHLRRVLIKDSKEEFLDVSLTYSVTAKRPVE